MADGIFFDARSLIALQSDLGKVPGELVTAVTAAHEESGKALRDEWASNVEETGGTHLPWLPDAITPEMQFGIGTIGVEVGPETGKKQGKLGKGDEYGSRNTPAHMSGHRATDTILPRHERNLDAALVFGMRPVTDG